MHDTVGWSVEEGVEATYGFINACVNVVSIPPASHQWLLRQKYHL